MKNSIKSETYIYKIFALLFVFGLVACVDAPTSRDYRSNARTPNAQIYAQDERNVKTKGQLNPYDFTQYESLDVADVPHDTVKIALLAPLTGKAAKLGSAFVDAAQLGVFTEGSSNVQIMPFDTKGTPAGALEAVNKAALDFPDVIIGPLFSDNVKAVAPVARSKGIKIFAFSNDKTVAGNGVYILGLRPDQQIERVVAYSARRGIDGYAASIPLNELGREVKAALNDSAKKLGKKVYFTEDYSLFSAPDYSKNAREIATKFEKQVSLNSQSHALVLPESGPALERLLLSLQQYQVTNQNVRFIGTAAWDNPETYTIGALDNAWYAAVPYANMNSFMINFQENFGYRPPQLASLSYDAVLLAAELGKDGLKSSQINRPDGFYGVNGAYRFLPSGVSQRKYDVVEINYGRITVVDSAPSFF